MLNRIKSSYGIELLFALLFMIVAAVLNIQFLSGANLNRAIAGHDEYLSIKDVYSILEPLSMKHFFLAVMHGSFLAYGSLMFYVDALIAFIPYKLFGLSGMVYAIRMTHAFFLAMGVSLLSITFLNKPLNKVLFLLAALGIAHSFYFAMMPKPEPMQLFFFALFFYYWKKHNWSFGRHFFWLGIAFGLKITLLIFLPFVFLFPILKGWSTGLADKLKSALWSLFYFLAGFIVAVPYLAMAVIRPSYLESYLDANVRNTAKSYDDNSIGLFDWLRTGLGEPYMGWDLAGVVLFSVTLLIFIAMGYRSYQRKLWDAEVLIPFFAILFIAFIGLKVDRLWAHYMWMGYILAGLSVFMISDKSPSAMIRKSMTIVGVLLVLAVAYRFIDVNHTKYFLADKEAHAVKRISESQLLFKHLETQYSEGLSIASDATIQYPYDQFVISNVYHPFDAELPEDGLNHHIWYIDGLAGIWDKENDIVVFGDRHPIKYRQENQKLGPEWDVELHAEQFKMHVGTDFELDTIIGGLEVYKRVGLIEK